MDRRDFLKLMASMGIALVSGTFSAFAAVRQRRPRPGVSVRISLNDSDRRIICVRLGTSVMGAIVHAYPCQTGSGGTIIDGQLGPWKYYLNGTLPTVHASNAYISRRSTVELRNI